MGRHAAQAPDGAGSPVSYNRAFLRGATAASVDLALFEAEQNLPPGAYAVDVYVNGAFLKHERLTFRRSGQQIRACLARQLIVDANVIEDAIASPWPDGDCKTIDQAVQGATEFFESSRMRLDLTLAQASLRRVPRGFVPESAWDSGETAAFVNYSGSYFSSASRGAPSLASTYVSLQNGANLGAWQWRNASSLRHTARGGIEFGWGSSFARRPLPAWRSQLTLGETSAGGTLFDAVNFRGARLASDERMLSPNRQGYAPVVRGIAHSRSRVVIRQASAVVYETSVPPGEFVLDDLYPTQNSGDLNVELTGADGSVRRFVVPFSAVAASLRPGLSRYAVTLGTTRTGYASGRNAGFVEATYERGISNRLTLHGGAQVAGNQFVSLAGGAVLATAWGAFGLGANLAAARAVDLLPSTGWQFRSSYSTSIAATQTGVTLAGYRHSTAGYRSLTDTLSGGSIPYYTDDLGNRVRSSTFRQKNRFDLMLSQPMGRRGSLYASAIRQDYYDDYRPGTQFQIGYQHTWAGVGYSIQLSRQPVMTAGGGDRSQTVALLTVSIPLEFGPRSALLTTGVSRRGGGGSELQSALTGTVGADEVYAYGLNVSRDAGNRVSQAGVNLGRSTSVGAYDVGYSRGADASAFSASGRGSLVAHAGGLLLGPSVGDTFGIVQAEGGAGAQLTNAAGVTLDGAGYGIIPALAPYSYNTVTLDPVGVDGHVELEETQKRVAPYAGAIPRIQFKTRTGYPVLIDVRREDGRRLPIGAPVLDAQGQDIGVVGQGSRLYARLGALRGIVSVALGPAEEACQAAYDLSQQDLQQALIRTSAVCRTVDGAAGGHAPAS